MHVVRSTAGRKEDVRDKTSRLVLKAESDDERLFLAALADAILDNTPIGLDDKWWTRERIAEAKA